MPIRHDGRIFKVTQNPDTDPETTYFRSKNAAYQYLKRELGIRLKPMDVYSLERHNVRCHAVSVHLYDIEGAV